MLMLNAGGSYAASPPVVQARFRPGLDRGPILFHDKRHPVDLGATEVEAFLTYLAVDREVSAATQNQAQCALLFLYREVLGVDLPWLDNVERAKRPVKLPVVLTIDEVTLILERLTGTHRLIGRLMYGAGLRILPDHGEPAAFPARDRKAGAFEQSAERRFGLEFPAYRIGLDVLEIVLHEHHLYARLLDEKRQGRPTGLRRNVEFHRGGEAGEGKKKKSKNKDRRAKNR